MRVLSLFDGMSCGMLAFERADIPVERYVAYEIDKYAIQVSTHNYEGIEQRGDVFDADFKEFKGFDFVIGGSPCTYWSIAKSNGRETEAHGIGWNLFQQYVRAVREAEPKFFVYENNKSMSDTIRNEISSTFGFEPIGINSALVSAQNRQRLYWVGIRQDDGTYLKAPIEQPKDRGILLKDVLDGMVDRKKSRAIIGSIGRTTQREYFLKSQGQVAFEPVAIASRTRCKQDSLDSYKRFEAREDEKANCMTTVQTDSMVAEPVRVGTMPLSDGTFKDSQASRIYDSEGKVVSIKANAGGMGAKTGLYAVPLTETKDGKSYAITANYTMIAKYPNDYAAHSIEKSVKPVVAEPFVGQKTPSKVYEVNDGMITIKEKQYPIKLPDGYYIIRKLTVSECKRLQTVPEDYDMSVLSDTQSYKCLGNGWTVDVIAHIFTGLKVKS